MDPLYIIKIIAPLITGIIALIAGIIELRLNSKNWLNRWFFSFFFSASLGYLVYSVYHLGIFSPTMISVLATITQILFNFIPISLVMTVFVLEKFPKKAMSPKYFGIMIVIFILMSIGYIWWYPELDTTSTIVNTNTPVFWHAFVNILRVVLFSYTLLKYAMIIKKTEDEAKKRMRWFFIGILIIIIGVVTNLLGGGFFKFVPAEAIALILFNIGAIVIVKGFFI